MICHGCLLVVGYNLLGQMQEGLTMGLQVSYYILSYSVNFVKSDPIYIYIYSSMALFNLIECLDSMKFSFKCAVMMPLDANTY